MSATQRAEARELVDSAEQFFKSYYHQEILELAQQYPGERRSLFIDWGDLYRFDPDIADDWLDQPSEIQGYFEDALATYDLPIDVELTKANVCLVGLNDTDVYGVGQIRSKHTGKHIGVRGHLEQVTEAQPKIEEAAFECQRCGTMTHIPQNGQDFQEPHECQGCERQGPFNINTEHSEYVDRRKVQIKQPPEDAPDGQGATLTAYMEGDLADPPGIGNLEARVGEDVVVYGNIALQQKTSGNKKTNVFDQFLEGRGINFERAAEDIDPYEYKDEFEPVATGPDAYETFMDCLAPDVYPFGRWPLAFKLATTYLFSSPRIDRPGGSTHRGDVHMGIFGPPGVGKSQFSENVAELSPGCEHRSATGLSSDVGLTAAATQDDFADGDGWTLAPGILPRAEDHAILDEADKADVNLSKINDALEGKQMASIDKGGISAELKTRVGFMAMGNPNDGRWNDHDPIKEQVDIDDSLWTRFDGIVILEDQPDQDMDEQLAEHVLSSHREDAAKEKADREGDDPDTVERDATATELSREAMRAWVMYARENVFPQLTDSAAEKLKEYYVEIRNDSNNADGGHPTARKLDAGIRFSKAFARLRLSETVDACDVDMAIELSKSLVGQTFDSDYGLDYAALTEIPSSKQQEQDERVKTMRGIINSLEGPDHGAPVDDVLDEAERSGIERSRARAEIAKLKNRGDAYEPSADELRLA